MNWRKLFQIQKELDQRIIRKHQLEGENLIDRKILAFQVELGEMANETRCFKFWSLKPSSPHEKILEEYVDGLHFLLSIGLDMAYVFEALEPVKSDENLSEGFQSVYRKASCFEQEKSHENYRGLFQSYLTLSKRLDFTEAEIMGAYLEKNEVNHQRQEQGY